MKTKRQTNPKLTEFEQAVDDGTAKIEVALESDQIYVTSTPLSNDDEKCRAFLLLASTIASELGMSPAQFAKLAFEFAYRIDSATEARMAAMTNRVVGATLN